MKNFLLVIGFLFVYTTSFSQDLPRERFLKQKFPSIDELVRINQLKPAREKIRMVLDTDTYNEIDDRSFKHTSYGSQEIVSVRVVRNRKT